ncbi:hypothetical protein [Nioella aestuarii]|uniref:hypothetical protein n=1 Tax=Nioella aestuarii TaxID=1662864 RepID=UPI003D7FF176
MKPTPLIAAFIGALSMTQAAQADIFSQTSTFSGDLCATDVDGAGDYDDCATIAGNTGVRGVYDFVLTGLNPDAQGDVTIRLTSPDADLFADPGANNPNERFRLLIEGANFGLLFDGSEADEARVNASLAASVQQNIIGATGSASALDLSFDLPRTAIAPFLQDGELIVRLDFREDGNINRFADPTVTVSYEVPDAMPAPELAGLAAEVAQLRAVVERQTQVIEDLTRAIEALQSR